MNIIPIYPELIMGIGAFLVILLGMVTQNNKVLAGLSAVVALFSLSTILLNFSSTATLLSGSIQITSLGNIFNLLFIAALLFTLYSSVRDTKSRPEIYYALLLFATLGMMFVSFSNNLIMIFVAFETSSIATYALTAYNKEKRALEASLKYFVTGAVSSAFLVFGISYLFLASGSFSFSALYTVSNTYSIIGLVLLVVGFGFKLALFPFHSWAVDTYTGARSSLSAFLSTASKLMALIAIVRLVLFAFYGMKYDLYIIFAILSVLTMTFGNIVALVQKDVKRMLAYSSIANAGYLSLFFVIAGYTYNNTILGYGLAALLIFSIAYLFMKAGLFIATSPFEGGDAYLDRFAGLGKKAPLFGLSIALLLMSLAGIPPTLGFVGKYYLFLALIESNLLWLAIIAIINSAISVFYYFRVIMYMYWKPSSEPVTVGSQILIPVFIAALAVIVLGIFSPYLIGSLNHIATVFLGGI
jgi:NADH-quinone oxidoreductase subunit N